MMKMMILLLPNPRNAAMPRWRRSNGLFIQAGGLGMLTGGGALKILQSLHEVHLHKT
jgi:hypothetical protein